MNGWTDEQRAAFLILLDRLAIELKRMNDVVGEIERRSTRTYELIYEDGSRCNTALVLSAEEREEFERVQGEKPEGKRWRLVGIPERVEDRG